MKQRQLLALAALASLSVPAAAQSSVTMYGLIGLEFGKNPGSESQVVQNGANSRLGVRGQEDLGGGLRAFFNLENRYEPDTGTQSDTRFWNGRSVVGLEGGFGRFWMGREYTPLFINVALAGDPWGWTGIGALDSGLAGVGAYTRYDNTLNYQYSVAGLTAWVQTAERDNNGNSAGTAMAQKRPMSLAVTYGNGPLFVGFGYDTRINDNDGLWTLVGTYAIGTVKLHGTYASGKTATGVKNTEIALAATAQLGAGQLRLGMDQVKRDTAPSTTLKQQVSLGYHYLLSKRTTVFADVTNDSKVAASKSGYGFGVKHAF
ncbi:MAG: porin [Rubrivivax sp.]